MLTHLRRAPGPRTATCRPGQAKAPSPPRDPADDCETPDVAYAHRPALAQTRAAPRPPPGALRIWDPYYCAGGVKARLGALGFGDVVNDPDADFYDVVDGSRPPPPHDICVTNPPCSEGNHARPIVRVPEQSRRPDGAREGTTKGGPVARFVVLASRVRAQEGVVRGAAGDVFHGAVAPVLVRRGGEGRRGRMRRWSAGTGARERSCPGGETCPFVHVGPEIDPEGSASRRNEARARRGIVAAAAAAGSPWRRLTAAGTVTWESSPGAWPAWRQKHERRERVGVRMVDGVGLPPPRTSPRSAPEEVASY